VTFYNAGDEYLREAISARGDECEWFATDIDADCIQMG
jgi:hypothetical protein